jgi:putative lipoprotein
MRRAAALLLVLLAARAPAQVDPDPWLGPDKALHFGVSAAIAGFAYGGTSLFTEHRGVRVGVATGVALSAGIAKELFDLSGAGQASWKDLTWDALGTAVGVVVSWLLDVFVFTPLSRPPPAAAPSGP